MDPETPVTAEPAEAVKTVDAVEWGVLSTAEEATGVGALSLVGNASALDNNDPIKAADTVVPFPSPDPLPLPLLFLSREVTACVSIAAAESSTTTAPAPDVLVSIGALPVGADLLTDEEDEADDDEVIDFEDPIERNFPNISISLV